jgi:hypothetical protein
VKESARCHGSSISYEAITGTLEVGSCYNDYLVSGEIDNRRHLDVKHAL